MKNQIIQDLQSEQVVTVPTETVEGYAVMLNSKTAVQALMKLKDRGFDSTKIFTLVPESKDAIAKYAIIPQKAQELIEKYIPGELTIVLPKNPDFHHFYYDHYDTIGIRIPDYPLFTQILPKVGPLILTSANHKGDSPKSLTGHLPSTVVDYTSDQPKILRQGDLKVL